MAISGTLTTSPRCLPNQGKLLQKESMVNQSHDSGVDSMNTNSSGNLKKYVDIFREFFIILKVLQFPSTPPSCSAVPRGTSANMDTIRQAKGVPKGAHSYP